MPQMLATALVPWISNALIAIGLPGLAFGASVGAIALGASYLLLAGAAYLVSAAVNSSTASSAPKPEDGKYNLKQSVPPLVYVLGTVKKAGDYILLEEKKGKAHHIIMHASHSIKGYKRHWLHDEAVTLNGSGFVTSPSHFDQKVKIQTRLGSNASTAYSDVVSAFPSIWSNDHRGDGLATVYMAVASVEAEEQQKVFPNFMPQHSAEIEGHNQIYDPRDGSYKYTENIALFRLWHMTSPVGAKLKMEDMHLPDWIAAANSCDEIVTNRSGGTEPRFHGGFWFRANNSPVQIGNIMDQAAELVIYETAEGKVGVHSGEIPSVIDVRLTPDDIVSIIYDANKRKGSNVLAVRGRYTDPQKNYNTADAAIYGIPYPSDDERTKSVENQLVQRHRHIAALQKLRYIRSNAPRVRVIADYDAAEEVPYRRFIIIHHPPKMVESIVEIIGRPVLSLKNQTYEFEGIIVPRSLYNFDAAVDEGEPGSNVSPVEREDVPLPENFSAVVKRENTGSGLAPFIEASFSFQEDNFRYEIEWQATSGGEIFQRIGPSGDLIVRTYYLADGVQYRIRARAWSADTPSDWTPYQILTAVSDPTAPGTVILGTVTGGAGQISFSWTAPNSPNYHAARIYLNSTNSFSGATLQAVEFGAPNTSDSRVVSGLPAGVWYGFITASNSSGVESAPVPTGAKTVT